MTIQTSNPSATPTKAADLITSIDAIYPDTGKVNDQPHSRPTTASTTAKPSAPKAMDNVLHLIRQLHNELTTEALHQARKYLAQQGHAESREAVITVAAAEMLLQPGLAQACAESTIMALASADGDNDPQQDPAKTKKAMQRCRLIALEAAYNAVQATMKLAARYASQTSYSAALARNEPKATGEDWQAGGTLAVLAVDQALKDTFKKAAHTLRKDIAKLQEILAPL